MTYTDLRSTSLKHFAEVFLSQVPLQGYKKYIYPAILLIYDNIGCYLNKNIFRGF